MSNNNTNKNSNSNIRKLNSHVSINQKLKNGYSTTLKKVKDNKIVFFFGGVVIVVLLFLLMELTFHKRTTKKVNNYNHDVEVKQITPLDKCEEILISEEPYLYKLCDYTIISSYNSLLVGNQKRDYLSLEMFKKVLNTGARYIEFEINPSNLTDLATPMVGTGQLVGNWSLSLNQIPLREVLQVIRTHGFAKGINHPLIIYLKFNSHKNNIINQVGIDFTEILGDKLIEARNYRIGIISRENMCNLNHKIIVLSSLDEPQLSDTKFEEIAISSYNNLINRIHYSEIANYVPDIRDDKEIGISLSVEGQELEEANFERLIEYNGINPNRPPRNLLEVLMKERERGRIRYPLKHFNKFGITIVIPHKPEDTDTLNYNFEEAMAQGCQIMAMNFQEEEDKTMFSSAPPNKLSRYLNFFNNQPAKRKPDALIYKPDEEEPTKIVLSHTEEITYIPNLYKIDFDLSSLHKIFRLKRFDSKYLDVSTAIRNRPNIFKLLQTNTHIYNFMIFGNPDIEQSIMISPIDGMVPINRFNRHYMRMNEIQTSGSKEYKFTFEQLGNSDTEIDRKNKANSSFYAIKSKNASSIENELSFSNIVSENPLFFYSKTESGNNASLTLKTDSTEELVQDDMTFALEEVPNLKMYIYIGYKRFNKQYYLENLQTGNKNSLLFKKVERPSALTDSYRFEVLPSIGDREIFKEETFILKAKNGRYLTFCGSIKANELDEDKASVLKIAIKKDVGENSGEIISLYDPIEKEFLTHLSVKEHGSEDLPETLTPVFISNYLALKDRKDERKNGKCVNKNPGEFDKEVEINQEDYTVQCLLEYK
jgi:hypothetical protein